MRGRSTLKPVSLRGAVQALVLLATLVLIAGTIVGELTRGLLVGSIAFLLLRYGLVRQVLCHDLRNGMALARSARHVEALKAFARSAEVWEGRRWLDDFRGLLLGSASRWPFRHLSRYNEAWCLTRLGHHAEARAVLRSLLHEQPGMDVATDLLRSLDAEDDPDEPDALEPNPGDWQDLLQDEPTIDPGGVGEA